MPTGLIVKALSGYYYVHPDEYPDKNVIQCRARGILKKQRESPLVGDYVTFSMQNDDEGTVNEIANRNIELIRPPIANVNVVVIVCSVLEPALNCKLLDRLLVHIEHTGLHAIIVLTKCDLIDVLPMKKQTEVRNYMHEIIKLYTRIGYDVISMNAHKRDGYQQLEKKLQQHISVLAGQSGVGKSSLLNAILPHLHLKTDKISHRLGRGKHTTRHVELLPLPYGGYVADTPGFSQLDFIVFQAEQLGNCFREFKPYVANCKFRNCTHIHEPGCQVKIALANGQIVHSRYSHYRLFYEEMKKKKRRY